jgi:K+-transporting ATPase A subunit
MNGLHGQQLARFLAALVVAKLLLGGYVAGVFGCERMTLAHWLGPADRWLCRIDGCELTQEMGGRSCASEISQAALC